MKRLLILVGAVAILSGGCTRLPVDLTSVTVESRAVDGVATTTTTMHVEVDYWTVLQNRNLSIDRPGWGKLDYSTSNDPVVKLAGLLGQMAAQTAASGGAQP